MIGRIKSAEPSRPQHTDSTVVRVAVKHFHVHEQERKRGFHFKEVDVQDQSVTVIPALKGIPLYFNLSFVTFVSVIIDGHWRFENVSVQYKYNASFNLEPYAAFRWFRRV